MLAFPYRARAHTHTHTYIREGARGGGGGGELGNISSHNTSAGLEELYIIVLH